jgi:hypothetical protein
VSLDDCVTGNCRASSGAIVPRRVTIPKGIVWAQEGSKKGGRERENGENGDE